MQGTNNHLGQLVVLVGVRLAEGEHYVQTLQTQLLGAIPPFENGPARQT